MINTTLVAVLADSDVQVIGVRFPGHKNNVSYTYKYKGEPLKEGDLVVVPEKDPLPARNSPEQIKGSDGYKVAIVHNLCAQIDLNSSFAYKWIVGKVDFENYLQVVFEEQEMIRKYGDRIRQKQMDGYREKFRQVMEGESDELLIHPSTEVPTTKTVWETDDDDEEADDTY